MLEEEGDTYVVLQEEDQKKSLVLDALFDVFLEEVDDECSPCIDDGWPLDILRSTLLLMACCLNTIRS